MFCLYVFNRLCRCTFYCVLVKTSDYFQKLINLINNCECCWGTPGARWGCLVATSDLSRGNTEGDMCTLLTLHHSVATLPTPVWKFLSLFYLKYILHSILNSSTFVSYLLSTAQLTMLLWQLDNLCGNQPNIFLILINIWNLFEISNPKQESLIISSYSSSYWKSASSTSFTLDRISQTLIGVCNLTVVAQ